MEADDRLLTIEQAADYLQIAPKTVREWLRVGRLPGVKIGRVWRIREASLRAWVEQRESGGAE